jgi:hypothetical protein
MNLAMVTPAQRDCEFIAHLAAGRWTLRKAQVVGIRWLAAANQARLLGNKPHVIAVADPPMVSERRFRNWRDGIARDRWPPI